MKLLGERKWKKIEQLWDADLHAKVATNDPMCLMYEASSLASVPSIFAITLLSHPTLANFNADHKRRKLDLLV